MKATVAVDEIVFEFAFEAVAVFEEEAAGAIFFAEAQLARVRAIVEFDLFKYLLCKFLV